MNFQMFKLLLEKAEESEIKLPTSLDHQKSKRVPENIYFCLLTMPKPLTVWITQTVENSEIGGNTRSPDLPLENLYAAQEATVRTGHGTTDWFQIGKGVRQGCVLSPCLFNSYAE